MEHVSEPDRHPAASGDRAVVYLHIGAPKTGTTYLQNVLWRNRRALGDDGVLYPGHTIASHVHAAFDLRHAGFQGHRDQNVPGAWARIVEEARAWKGRVIISQELFSPATVAQVDRAMGALSFADVHLVYTARDLARQIPAAWQEDVKNRFTLGFSEFADSLRAPEGERHRLGTMFWRMQDAVEVLHRWSRGLPPDHVHVVTVPPPGGPNGLLWQRFAGLLGLDAERYDTAGAAPNLSLGAAEASMLRRLNLALDDSVPWPVYGDFVKHFLGQDVLARRPDPIKIVLTRDMHAWTVERSRQLIEGLRGAGYDVVGDLADLVPTPASESSTRKRPDEVPPDLQLEAAVDAMAGLLERVARMPGQGRPLHRQVRELEEEVARRRRHPVKTLVRDFSEKHPAVMKARAVWWHAVEWTQPFQARFRRRME